MKNRLELAAAFGAEGFRVGAEIGVAEGYYARVLCEAMPGLTLYLVDPWDGRGGRDEATFQQACETLAPFDVHVLRMLSVDASVHVPDHSLDFVYIDAAHDFESVYADIAAWAPKVRAGGILSGHDYYTLKGSPIGGVVNAVDEYIAASGHRINVTPWDKTLPHRDDWQPSWWVRL